MVDVDVLTVLQHVSGQPSALSEVGISQSTSSATRDLHPITRATRAVQVQCQMACPTPCAARNRFHIPALGPRREDRGEERR